MSTTIPSAEASFIPACGPTGIAKQTSVCHDVQSQSGNPVIRIIKDGIDILSFVTGVVAVIMIIVSGIRFIVSGGDSNAVAGAKKSLIGALIGIVVVVLAQSIVIFVLDKIK
ncbi:pilin [Patescibacteria group bacterium]|nr:pilin [Patescibacteria group bacterium]